MSSSKVVAVAGASGAQGGALARRLLAGGHRVHAVVRDAESPSSAVLRSGGARVFAGDFDDRASLVRAMRGADAAFVMATPFLPEGTTAEVRHGKALVDAAVEAGVGHVVYSSVASADRGTGVPHFESKNVVEGHLHQSGLPWTVVAPTEFLDMVVAPWALPGLRAGSIGVPVSGHAPRQLTVVDDVAAFVVLAIEQPGRFLGRRVEIASDVTTGDKLAAALARATGRDVRYAAPPLESVADTDLRAMYAFLEAGGYQVDVAAVHAAHPEVDWHGVDAWLGRQSWPTLLSDGDAA